MLNPQIAHLVDAGTLRRSVPGLSPSDLHDVRSEFAWFLTTPRARATYQTWQEAWNAFTGATPHRPGALNYTTSRCSACNGRRYDHRRIARNISRTGSPYICGECRGTGRGQRVTKTALYVEPPAPEPTDTPETPQEGSPT